MTDQNSENMVQAKSLGERMWHFQQMGKICDVVFLVGVDKTQIKAHKTVLSCGSSVFLKMFEGSLPETDIVQIPDIEEDVFIEILKFLYTDKCAVGKGNVDGILNGAEKYDIQRLKDKCYQVLVSNLSIETVWQTLHLSDVYSLSKLFSKCLSIYETKPIKCLESDNFLDLPSHLFAKIIAYQSVSCKEEKIYEACLRWVKRQCKRENKPLNDSNIREQLQRGNVLHKIRFIQMDMDYFTKNISSRKILSKGEIINVYQSVHSKESCGGLFLSDARHNKVCRLMRCRVNTDSDWVVGRRSAIAVCFKERILLHGIIVFGPKIVESNYKLDVAIKTTPGEPSIAENNQRAVSAIQGQALKFKDNQHFYDVLLKVPIELERRIYYNIELCMNGPITYTGIDYKTDVSDGNIRVTIKDSSLSDDGTSVCSGQIPGLIVSIICDD